MGIFDAKQRTSRRHVFQHLDGTGSLRHIAVVQAERSDANIRICDQGGDFMMRHGRLDDDMLFQTEFADVLRQHLALTGTSAPDDVESNRLAVREFSARL
jgi:hypothetical protein